MKYFHLLSLPNYIYFKVKEVPDPDGPLSESINRLANPRADPCAITSANIQNGFGRNEEDKKHVLYPVYQ